MKVATAVRLYVAHKRSMGWEFSSIEKLLVAFAKHVGDVQLSDVSPHEIALFLSGPRTSSETWHQSHQRIQRFFEHWTFRGHVVTLPMPPLIPRQPRTFVPYIYSRSEIGRLVSESAYTKTTNRIPLIDHLTFRTLLLFLYGTGVLVSEALALRECNVDLKNNAMVIQRRLNSRIRVLPIGPDVHKLLKTYLDSPIRRRFHSTHFFLTRKGMPVKASTLIANFHELRGRAGVVRLDGACYQPRMHDLRSTFAVHRIAAWYDQGVNAQLALPALGAYLGQTGFASIIRHLALTPEHFRKQIAQGN